MLTASWRSRPSICTWHQQTGRRPVGLCRPAPGRSLCGVVSQHPITKDPPLPHPKFSATSPDGRERPVAFPDAFDYQQAAGGRRIAATTSRSYIDLLAGLGSCLPGPHFCLYVLCVSRTDRVPGRYQSPGLDLGDLAAFLATFRDFFEQDARHNLWIGCQASRAQIVYDRHNVVYAYGPLGRFDAYLRSHEYQQTPIVLPDPHIHHYWEDLDPMEDRLFRYLAWTYHPLQGSQDQ